MTRYIQIVRHRGGRHRYTVELVDHKGEVRKQHHFFNDADTIDSIDFLLRMGYEIAGASEAVYLELMQHEDVD